MESCGIEIHFRKIPSWQRAKVQWVPSIVPIQWNLSLVIGGCTLQNGPCTHLHAPNVVDPVFLASQVIPLFVTISQLHGYRSPGNSCETIFYLIYMGYQTPSLQSIRPMASIYKPILYFEISTLPSNSLRFSGIALTFLKRPRPNKNSQVPGRWATYRCTLSGP